MKIKVCGLTLPAQVTALAGMSVDMAGLIFYDRSPRFIADLDPLLLPANISKVGVFVNAPFGQIVASINRYKLSFVQLHGNESPELCGQLLPYAKLIKVFSITEETDLSNITQPYKDVCDYFLFDTAGKNHGGTGKKFNWEQLKGLRFEKPFFLSGGIAPGDIDCLRTFHHPDMYAIDINGRFETSPGIKDMEAIKIFSQSLNILS